MRNCLKKGLGFTICPKISVQSELDRGDLVELNWDETGTETTVMMIWHSEKWCSPLLKEFMSLSENRIV